MEITDEQVSQLKRAVNLGRGDHSYISDAVDWVYRILDGEDVSDELTAYEETLI